MMTSTSIRDDRDRQAGFSLVEVLVASTIIGVVMLSYGALNLATAELAARNQLSSPASAAAAAKLEDLARLPYAQVVAGADRVSLPGGEVLDRTWVVLEDTPIAGCRTVTVTVVARAPEAVPVDLTTTFTDLGGSP